MERAAITKCYFYLEAKGCVFTHIRKLNISIAATGIQFDSFAIEATVIEGESKYFREIIGSEFPVLHHRTTYEMQSYELTPLTHNYDVHAYVCYAR